MKKLTPDYLRFTPPRLAADLLARFLEDRWGVTGDFKALAGERDQNICVRSEHGTQYVLKVASPIEDPTLVDFQMQALVHIQNADRSIPVPQVLPSLAGNTTETLTNEMGDHVIRLLSWVEGIATGECDPPSRKTIEQIGALQGRICNAFQGFEHDGAAHFMPWSIINGLLESHELRTRYLRDGFDKRCAESLQRLEHDSLPAIRKLPTQIIHNDAHSGNVLCDPENPELITGVIDFGDQIEGPLVVDLSTSLSSIIDRSNAPLEDVASLIKGFEQRVEVPDEQRNLLYDATLARSILTVQLLEYRVQNLETDPELRDIGLPECKHGLDTILSISPDKYLEAARR